VLDLYARCWQGRPLGAEEYVISADEKWLFAVEGVEVGASLIG
jgi:hypothetical protein